MAVFRFRVQAERAPASFWRDIEIGVDRSLATLGATIVDAVGIDETHRWFFGIEREYWASPVKYLCHEEYTSQSSGGPMWWDEDVFDAAETALETLGLERWNSLCFVCDYVNDRRFYAVLRDIDDRDGQRSGTLLDGRGQLQFDATGAQ